MDPDEQLCAGFLQNARLNKRIPIHKLNEYKTLCQKYGYDKQFEEIINNRMESPSDKVLIPTNKVLIPTNKVLVPTNKVLVPTNKVLIPSSPTNKVLIPSSPTNKVLIPSSPTDKVLVASSPTNKVLLSIELPERLWNWEVEKDEPPIPIKYPVIRQFNTSLIEKWRRTIAELSLIDPNLQEFDVNDLTILFDLYNLHFFNNSLPQTKLEISNGLTVTAGVCKTSRISDKCEYSITMSRSIFTKLNLEENQVTKSGGLICKSRLNCLQLVLEHEIIHLISGYYYPNRKQLDKKIYSGHGLLFKNLVKNYFGQTESTHQIGNIIYDGSDKERTLSKDEIKIGKIISIIDKKGIKKGVILNIYNKNVGVEFLDGDNWKVQSDFLHKVSEDDDDYNSLLDIKNELLSKLKIYNNVKIGDTVKFYFKTKDNIMVGQVTKLNNKSSKLSVNINSTIYTIVYSRLIDIIKTTDTIKTTISGKYTIKDFKIGDKVIIAGGKRSAPIYGTVFKLNRVNAQIKKDNSDIIWNAPYDMLSFQ